MEILLQIFGHQIRSVDRVYAVDLVGPNTGEDCPCDRHLTRRHGSVSCLAPAVLAAWGSTIFVDWVAEGVNEADVIGVPVQRTLIVGRFVETPDEEVHCIRNTF